MPSAPVTVAPAVVFDPIRRRVAHHRWLYWLMVTVGLVVSLVAATHPLRVVVDERAAWGSEVEVLVAIAAIEPGTALAPLVTTRRLPVAVVPDAAVSSLPAGATARRSLSAGQMLTTADITADSGPAALARPGDVVVAVVEAVPSGAAAGDLVVVVTEGVVLVERALVVGRRDLVVHLSVPSGRGAVVAAATAPALLLIPD